MKMAEPRENKLMDCLPNEMILEVFGHFEGLSDRDTLSKVSSRFNSLTEVIGWRKRLKLTDEEVERNHRMGSHHKRNQLTKEIEKSPRLEVLSIEYTPNSPVTLKTLYCPSGLKVVEPLTMIFKQCKRIRTIDIDIFFEGKLQLGVSKTGFMYFNYKNLFNPNHLSKIEDMLAICPVPLRNILLKRKLPSLDKVIKASCNSLENMQFWGDCIDMKVFEALSSCTKLAKIEFGQFEFSQEYIGKELPKVSVENFNLYNISPTVSPVSLNEFAAAFLTKKLTILRIFASILSRNLSLFVNTCTNLEYLKIIFDFHSLQESVSFMKNILIFCKQLQKVRIEMCTTVTTFRVVEEYFEEINFLLEDYYCYNNSIDGYTFVRNHDGFVFVCTELPAIDY